MIDMNKELRKHRVIGIRSALKAFKKEGLLEHDTLYPDDAVEKTQEQLTRTALRWYKIGARRGARVVLAHFLKSKITVTVDGRHATLETELDALPWPKKTIRIRVGKRHLVRAVGKFELEVIKDLGFKR
ncbi:MAG: hypothetical protein LAO21_17750 [Acidobacteriia bacterium]|nr:hypothetical protein [Terriglobia bacterium]